MDLASIGKQGLTNFLSGTAKAGPYTTPLPMVDEMKFQQWAKQNNVPLTNDYDMRGYWKALQAGNPIAVQAGNGHYPDVWKTPVHQSFSNESIYATPNAPHWFGNKLVDKLGSVLFDEDKR